jgi:hypothetical protein
MSGGSKDRPETAIYVAHEEHIPRDPTEAERNLMRAVLNSAIADIQKAGDPAREAQIFFKNDDEDYLFSFKNICAQLDLCPSTILSIVGLNKSKHRSV